jgi:hypothetical protein
VPRIAPSVPGEPYQIDFEAFDDSEGFDFDPAPLNPPSQSLSNSVNPLADYHAALENDPHALFITATRWILVRDFTLKSESRLSYSNYRIITAFDEDSRAWRCSCDMTKGCPHLLFVLRRADLGLIRFPNESPSQLQYPFIQIVREYPADEHTRRLLLLTESPAKQPVLIVQYNEDLTSPTAFHCRCFNQTCGHISLARHFVLQNQLPFNIYKPLKAPREFGHSISKQRVPLPAFLEAGGANQPASGSTFLWLNELLASPSETPVLYERCCPECKKATEVYNRPIVSNARLYRVHRPHLVCVSFARCTNVFCSRGRSNELIPYDGRDDGVFNYNNRKLFGYDLLYLYMSGFSATSFPMSSFVLTINRLYEQTESLDSDPKRFIQNPVFVNVWFSFLKLIEWDYKFCCPRCGINPNVLLCDGTSVSIRRSQAINVRSPANVPPDLPLRPATKVEAEQTRCFPESTRKEITKYLQILSINTSSSAQIAFVTRTDDELYSSLKGFCTYIVSSRAEAHQIEPCLLLLKVLAADESLMALINPRVYRLGMGIMALLRLGKPVAQPKALAFLDVSPLLHSVLDSCYAFAPTPHLPPPVFTFFIDLLARAASIHAKYNELQLAADQIPRLPLSAAEKVSDFDAYFTSDPNKPSPIGKFYSKRPVLRKIQRYTIDQLPQKTRCRPSKFGKHQKFTGGIMVFWCPHSICYGFHMIEGKESARDVMAAIMSHWERAPDMIIYDDACHLMDYCHAREWGFFKDTIFLVDLFHMRNHVCSDAHSSKVFKQSRSMSVVFVNTSASEVGNSKVTKIKDSVHAMKSDTAFLTTLHQLEMQNVSKMKAFEGKSLGTEPESETESESSSESDQDEPGIINRFLKSIKLVRQ